MQRQALVWIVKGLGGLITILNDWRKDFGPIDSDQLLILEEIKCRLNAITGSPGKIKAASE